MQANSKSEDENALESLEIPETVIFLRDGDCYEVPYHAGETLLETGQRAGLVLPFSCCIGSCATCMARVVEGEVQMLANNVLTDDEVAEGLVLVCQGMPLGRRVVVAYA